MTINITLNIRGVIAKDVEAYSPIPISRILPEREVEHGIQDQSGAWRTELRKLAEGVSWKWSADDNDPHELIGAMCSTIEAHIGFFTKTCELANSVWIQLVSVDSSKQCSFDVVLYPNCLALIATLRAGFEIIYRLDEDDDLDQEDDPGNE